MRHLVPARVKLGKETDLLAAIESGTLGTGSVAGGEYLRNMREARLYDGGLARWVKAFFCDEPLAEERPFCEEFIDLVRVRDTHRPAGAESLSGPSTESVGGSG